MENSVPPSEEMIDGKFIIRIDANFMAAYLSCKLPHGGGKPVQMQNVLHEIEAKEIKAALNLEAIEKTLKEGGDHILIASGKQPVPGIDGKFESLLPGIKKRSPHLDEHGLANFRDLGEIMTVHAGDKLMRLVLPTTGEAGQTVTGKLLPVKPGKKISFSPQLEGAMIDPKDPTLLIAEISGSPVLLKDGVSVESVYTVNNVDLHTGNLSYEGTVHVTGDVHTDMTIKATGDILVDGTVENAMLEAGGDITVKGGILGSSEAHDSLDKKFQASIKCSGSCTAQFVQNAHIFAGNSIFIHEVAMQSELTAAHQIIVGDKNSQKGEIIGGVSRATMLIQSRNIGSTARPRTIIIAGSDKQLHEQLNDCNKKRETLEERFASILKLIDMAHKIPGRVPPEALKSAEATRTILYAEIDSIREDELAIHKEINLSKGAKVIAIKKVFGGTEVRFGLKHYETAQDREGGIFLINEKGELVFN